MAYFYSAGHNPTDKGATAVGIFEHDICRAIVEQIRLLSPTSLFVPSDSLDKKIKWVNERCSPDDVAVEIHANIGFPSKKGAEGYYYSHPTNLNLAIDYSLRVAKVMGNGSAVFPDTHSAVGQLGWCRKLKCKSVLLEIGYLSNTEERAKMINVDMQRKIAEAIVGVVVPQQSKWEALLAVLKAFLPADLFEKVKPHFV